MATLRDGYDSIPPAPGVSITYELEPMWGCNHCGSEFVSERTWRLRLSGEFNPEVFSNAIDLCIPCAETLGKAITQTIALRRSEGQV